MKNNLNKYKKTSVQSANREKILLMLYEGAIRFTKQAIKSHEEGRLSDRGYYIGRVYDIILELNNTLDHKVGGEVALHLEQLYMYITDRLTQVTISGESEGLLSVLKILETLYDGWKQAVEVYKQNSKQSEKETIE